MSLLQLLTTGKSLVESRTHNPATACRTKGCCLNLGRPGIRSAPQTIWIGREWNLAKAFVGHWRRARARSRLPLLCLLRRLAAPEALHQNPGAAANDEPRSSRCQNRTSVVGDSAAHQMVRDTARAVFPSRQEAGEGCITEACQASSASRTVAGQDQSCAKRFERCRPGSRSGQAAGGSRGWKSGVGFSRKNGSERCDAGAFRWPLWRGQTLTPKGPMKGARIHAQPGDGGGSVGRVEAEAWRTLRGRDHRWGWTRGSHFGREFADWVVVRLRSRWRGD